MNKTNRIPTKNYIICSLIFLVIIVLSLVTYFVYDNQKKLESKIPVLRGKVLEITIDSVNEYLKENDNILLYVGVADDRNSRDLEEEMIPMVDKGVVKITYLNITDVANKKEFYDSFNEEYSVGSKLNSYPALVYIADNKINAIIQKENSALTISDVKVFLNNTLGDRND